MVCRMFSKLLVPVILAGALIVPEVRAADAPPTIDPTLAAPPSPPAPPPTDVKTGAATQPFKPAVRIPPHLPTKYPFAALNVLTNLVFDSEVKEQTVAPDAVEANFKFAVTNVSKEKVVISSVRTSCGCTVAQLPTLPWTLEPGTNGTFGIHMDIRGKRGSITKSVFVATDQGNKTIYVRTIIPDPPTMTDDQRKRNAMIAKADRQAVFKNDCATCHATPTFGKTGSALFEAACEICHGGSHRNEMVPDLNIAKQIRDYDYWRNWIANGKEGTLMPGFSREHGGPLTDAQIMSLAHYLTGRFPNLQAFPGAAPKSNP